MTKQSTADISNDEVAIYCLYQCWSSSYLLLISVSTKNLFTADISVDEVGI